MNDSELRERINPQGKRAAKEHIHELEGAKALDDAGKEALCERLGLNRLHYRTAVLGALLVAVGFVCFISCIYYMFNLQSGWRFLLAVLAAFGFGMISFGRVLFEKFYLRQLREKKNISKRTVYKVKVKPEAAYQACDMAGRMNCYLKISDGEGSVFQESFAVTPAQYGRIRKISFYAFYYETEPGKYKVYVLEE